MQLEKAIVYLKSTPSNLSYANTENFEFGTDNTSFGVF